LETETKLLESRCTIHVNVKINKLVGRMDEMAMHNHSGRWGYSISTALAVWAVLISPLIRAQNVPISPEKPWHSKKEAAFAQDFSSYSRQNFSLDANHIYTLAELVDLAEAHNPETRSAWENSLEQAGALGVARSELFPTLTAAVLSQTERAEPYSGTSFYRETIQSFELSLDLNYTIFDFGARSGRIDASRAVLLAANFAFNDVHRQLIYQVARAYYELLNASGQEEAARSSLDNAQAVQRSAEALQSNGLATLPDVLEAKSATAQAEYDLQAALGAEDVAHGNLATALGASPTSKIQVQPIIQLVIADSIEGTVEDAIDRAIRQRPDLMRQLASIRAANAEVKQAQAAYFPILSLDAQPDAQSLYAMEQKNPGGHTAQLDGSFTLSLSWTIFDGGARKSNRAQAKASLRQAESQAETTRDLIENGIWSAYSNLKTALRQRRAAQALLEAANQSYNAATESYRYGVRNLLDVTEAQRTLAKARSADVLAQARVLTALADLAFEEGDSIQPAHARPQP
jgi:outer membrane protein